MTVSVTELLRSRDLTGGDNPTDTLVYLIDGTNDAPTAETALLAVAPAVYRAKILQNYSIKRKGAEWFEAECHYARRRRDPATGEGAWAFDTTGGSQHITQSWDTQNYWRNGDAATDYNGAIGVTKNGVEGIDVVVPALSWSETHYLDLGDEAAVEAYVDGLVSITGTVNDAAYRFMDTGEGLFLGGRGQKRGEEDWQIDFAFLVSRNRTDIVIGDLPPISKKGHEYLWCRYADEVDEGSSELIQKPISAHVETVYLDGDWAALFP